MKLLLFLSILLSASTGLAVKESTYEDCDIKGCRYYDENRVLLRYWVRVQHGTLYYKGDGSYLGAHYNPAPQPQNINLNITYGGSK